MVQEPRAGNMSRARRRSARRAIATSRQADCQTGSCRCADSEIRIAKSLVRQSAKRDRLIRLINGKALRHAGGRVVIGIANLRGGDSAGPGAGKVNCARRRTGHRAIASSCEAH